MKVGCHRWVRNPPEGHHVAPNKSATTAAAAAATATATACCRRNRQQAHTHARRRPETVLGDWPHRPRRPASDLVASDDGLEDPGLEEALALGVHEPAGRGRVGPWQSHDRIVIGP